MATRRKAAPAKDKLAELEVKDKTEDSKMQEEDEENENAGNPKNETSSDSKEEESLHSDEKMEESDSADDDGERDGTTSMEEGESEEASDGSEDYEPLAKGVKKPASKKLKTGATDATAPKKLKIGATTSDATYLVGPTLSTHEIMMVAISSSTDKNGISVDGIKKYVMEHYPDKDWGKFKAFMKKALIKGLADGVIIRPKNSDATPGLTGRFKINKEHNTNKKTISEKPKKGSTESEVKGTAKTENPKLTSKSAPAPTKTVSARNAVASTKITAKAKTTPPGSAAKRGPAAKNEGKKTTAKSTPKSPKQPPKSPKTTAKSQKAPAKSPKTAAKSPKLAGKKQTTAKPLKANKSPKAGPKSKTAKET